MTTELFGMMNEAYFVSRLKIINWINGLLELEIKCIEDCASGAIYCQIVDSIFGPGVVPMRKVDFSAKYEHEYIRNYKILQEAFRKIGLSKSVPVDRLTKGKYQDNLEFLQWIYQWYERNTGTDGPIDYDALSRRLLSKGGKSYIFNATNNKTENARKKNKPLKSQGKNYLRKAKRISPIKSLSAKTSERQLEEVQRERNVLEERIKSLSGVAKDIESERDFYFQKVLKIEKTCLSAKENLSGKEFDLSKNILDILYEKDEKDKRADRNENSVSAGEQNRESNNSTLKLNASSDLQSLEIQPDGGQNHPKMNQNDPNDQNQMSWAQSIETKNSPTEKVDLENKMEDD